MSFQDVVQFSFKLLPLLLENEEEVEKPIIFSPSSILASMSMVVAGAKNSTAKEILKILGNEKTKEEVIKYYSNSIKKKVTQEKITKDGNVKIMFGNCLFVSKEAQLIPEFVTEITESFDAQIQQIDFKNGKKASDEINAYIAEKTEGKILDLTKPVEIKVDTLLYIVNSLYFYGKWENIFEKRIKFEFYGYSIDDERDGIVKRINEEETWNYTEGNEWECIGIPYKDYKAWMFIVLPKEKRGLKKLIKNLDYQIFMEFVKPSVTGYMRIIIPTFEIVADFNLNEKLQQLGISQAFENSCDFSGMMRPSGKIDEIIHGATIKVDQFGTEATSATLYKITQKNAPKDFRADHPFLYFITTSDNDYLSKDILFVGTYC